MVFIYTFFLSSQSVLCFPAAGNRTYRLWPDGDDGQAVPAQDHHCWHQRLCPPHWLRPHQEGGQELSLCFLLSVFCRLSSSDLPASRCLCSLFLIVCYECEKGMKLIQSFLLEWHTRLLFSDASHKAVQWWAEKRTLIFQQHKPDLEGPPHTPTSSFFPSCLLVQTGHGFAHWLMPAQHQLLATCPIPEEPPFCSVGFTHSFTSFAPRPPPFVVEMLFSLHHQMEHPTTTELCFH